MDIRISVPGATPEEIELGLAAARTVFSKAGITPEQAADAQFAVEGWDIKGFPSDEYPDDDEIQFCSVWDEADQAAANAICRDWPEDRRIDSADLELDDPEADAHREWLFAEMEAIRAGKVPQQ